MALKVLWCTGIRIGELSALTVGNFHRGDRSLYIAHAKNDRSRVIPVSESLAGELGDYIDARVPGGDPRRWLFPGRDPGSHRSKGAVGNGAGASTARRACSPARAGLSAPTTSATPSR